MEMVEKLSEGRALQNARPNSINQRKSIDLNAKSRIKLFEAWHKGRQFVLASTTTSLAEKSALMAPEQDVSLLHVVAIADSIDTHLKSQTTYRIIERIRPYIHGLEQFERALSTYANGSALVMAPLWGSTQVLLALAANFVDAFDQVLDMLQDIAENLPRFERYASVFKGRAMFQAALSLLYSDLAEFLTATIDFFCRRGIVVLWRSLWKPFKDDFDRTLSQLRKHILLVDNEAVVTGFEHNQDKLEQTFTSLEKLVTDSLRYSEKMVDQQRQTQEMMNALQLREVTRWLSAQNPQMIYEAALRRTHPSSGAWFLNLREFRAWLQAPKEQVLPMLWIHGAPCCGKTLLATKVIQHLDNLINSQKQPDEKFVLAYFFCDFKDITKRSCLAIARSIVSQLLAADPNLLPHAIASMNESGEAEAASSTRLFALAKDLLSTFPSTFILVDAIDECNTEERCLILDHLNDLTGPDSTTKVMILSRREPDIKKKMASCPSYAISSTDTSSDITQYVSTCLNQETNFSITIKQPLKLDIGHKLSKAAQGNFLWVRLMIDTLQKQPFEDYEQLKDAVTNLPLGLGSAYGRVLLQLLHQPKLFHNAAILALQLVTTSLRPLTIPQLRHAFSVLNDPNVALFVSQVHLSKFIEDTAGQILTVNSLKQVGFVHHTLSEFLTSPSELWTEDRRLISKFHVDLPKAHEMHAICCVESLLKGTYCLKDFDLQVCDKDHGYFDYAAEHWADHVSGASPATGTLIKHVSDFLESEKGMFWLVYRLQNPTAILTTLSQLMLVEYKLKIWSESSSDSDGIRKLVKNCVQTLYQRWHTRIKMKLPKSDPRLLESSNVLAQIHFVKGQYSESAEIYFSNMSLARQALGDDNPITLRCISGLAVVRTLQGRWAEAIELAREALQGQIALLGSMHQETLGGFELLGEAIVKGVHHIKDRTIEEMQIEGEEVLRTSLQGRRKLLGKEHPDTLKSLHNLARAFMAQNRYAEAEEALLEHRGIVKRVLGSDHRSYIHSMDDLAVVYLETGHPSEAEATHEYLLAQRTRLLGPEHPDTANSIWHLGVLQQDQGRYEQAIANLSLLEPLNTKNYGPSHRYTMKPMARIGEMYVALGQHEKAGPVLKRVVDNCDRTNATSIAMTVQSAKQLEYVYYQLGYKGKAKALKNRSWILEKPTDLALNKRTAAAGSWSSRRLLIALLAVVVLWFLTPSFRILTDPRGIFLFNSSHKSSCPP